jgi:hypothetical protein
MTEIDRLLKAEQVNLRRYIEKLEAEHKVTRNKEDIIDQQNRTIQDKDMQIKKLSEERNQLTEDNRHLLEKIAELLRHPTIQTRHKKKKKKMPSSPRGLQLHKDPHPPRDER